MRNRSLDVLRFVAVYAVVLQHSIMVSAHAGVKPSLAVLGSSMWAVPLLFAASGFLSTMRNRTVDLGRRMRRLLLPYAVWSVVLFAYAAQGAIRAGESLSSINWFGVVFAGEAYYSLWFLAMLVYVTLVGWALQSDRSRIIGAGIAMLAYAGLAIARVGQPILSTASIGGFLIIAPLCIAAYLAGAVLPRVPQPRGLGLPLGVFAVAVVVDAGMYATWGTDLVQNQQFAILSVGAVAALVLLWALVHADSGARAFTLAAWAGTFSLGVYVIHAPILNIVRYATHTRDATSFVWALVLSVVGTLVALALSYVISLVRPLRPLVQ